MQIEVRIVIGEYTIEPSQRDGFVWICHESGEGMEIAEAKLAALLEKFYAENF